MELYIQIRDGQTFGHPILESNFREAFPDIDTNNLPPEFARFVRQDPPPKTGDYKVVDSDGYQLVDGVWTDVYVERDMTPFEKERFDEEQNIVKSMRRKVVKDLWDSLPNRDNFTAWFFDEETMQYLPPIPRPDPINGVAVRWNGADNSWKEAPDRPTDGADYVFDYTNWSWVAS